MSTSLASSLVTVASAASIGFGVWHFDPKDGEPDRGFQFDQSLPAAITARGCHAHSALSASMGSTRDARRAGSQVAVNATTTRSPGATRNESGSRAETP
jgi:hypothetical protein